MAPLRIPSAPAVAVHPSRYRAHKSTASTELEFSRFDQRDKWIVKLSFLQGGSTHYGTGFYLNVPESKWDVILTAGHNLIDSSGKHSENVEVLQPSGESIRQDRRLTFISEKYAMRPDDAQNGMYDYGALLVSKKESDHPRGFGFSILLSGDQDRSSRVEISGYRIHSEPGQPITSSGKAALAVDRNFLVHEAATEPGMSGSAIFMAYRGHEAVVGIHTQGPKRGGRRKGGVLLTEDVLSEIFNWAGVFYHNKRLKVVHDLAHEKGIYLHFQAWMSYARVRVGTETYDDTVFDIFPGYAPPATSSLSPLYVFRCQLRDDMREEFHNDTRAWVCWDALGNRVTLCKSLNDDCFVRLVRPRKKNLDTFMIVLAVKRNENVMEELFDFRMAIEKLSNTDIEDGMTIPSEASFGRYRKGKRVIFNEFRFEQQETKY